MSTLAEIEAAMPTLSTEDLERLEAKARSFRLERTLKQHAPSDLSEFAGSLRLTEDPVAFQRRIREEWE